MMKLDHAGEKVYASVKFLGFAFNFKNLEKKEVL